jgi:group II intron reverse transcriptase/maturase
MKFTKSKRMQKISETDSCQAEDRAELEVMLGVQGYFWINENEITDRSDNMGILEYILSPGNLQRALQQVVSNKGVSGIDQMQTRELKDYVIKHLDEIRTNILSGKFKPQAVKRVEIPKAGGKVRQLGIPTVIDRMIQQAINQFLTPIYERQFSDNSFGFRPHRSAHDALHQVRKYVEAGYKYAVDMDLEKYFDTVNRSKLVEVLSKTIKDGRVISLIHKFLNAGVMIGSRLEPTSTGVPQGSPLSPLLGNIMLNELDKELEKRGHHFVRYADDMLILCRSRRAAERTLKSTTDYIEKRLFLRVNREKTVTANVSKVKFLGYSFYLKKGECRFRVHPKSWKKMKRRLREITCRSRGKGDAWRKQTLRYFVTGWTNYFRLADMNTHLQKIDEWLRRRLRMCIWKQWKRIKTKFDNLQKLGLSRQKSWEYANTRKSYWHTAGSFICSTTITNERLKRAGYIFFGDYFKRIQLPIPVY